MKAQSVQQIMPIDISRGIDSTVLEEVAKLLGKETGLPNPPSPKQKTVGMHPWDRDPYAIHHQRNYRHRKLTLEEIEAMLVCGQVLFPLMLKKAPIRSAFRDDTTWRIEAEKKTVAALIENNLRRILPKYMGEILTCMEYGASYFEVIAGVGTAAELNVDGNGIGGTRTVAAIQKLNSCYPGSIGEILKTSRGEFAGFTQLGGEKEVVVGPEQALIFNWNRSFRYKYGESYLRPAFTFWYWYEVIWRSFLNFLHRTGTPVAVCRYPHKWSFRPFTNSAGRQVTAEERAMQIAETASNSSSIIIPSERSDEGDELWSIEYLEERTNGQQFIKALEMLGTLITRSMILADTVAMQSGIVGGQAMSAQQRNITDLHTEWLLDEIVAGINEYLIPKLIHWNYGESTNARMVTQGIDEHERDRLFKLVTMLINAKNPDANRIDWRRVLDKEGLPLLSDAEYERKVQGNIARQQEMLKRTQEEKDSEEKTLSVVLSKTQFEQLQEVANVNEKQ